ncbi:MAG TPA: MT-A70 family methyltransferase [Devosiaceae bacterium]|nr:MT-A70 family methyltransferase [Devosiaceae bacterium]
MTDLPALAEPPGNLSRYERAVYWLDQAVRVDEVLSVRNEAEQLKVAGRQAKDRSLTANAVELQLRSERRLGEMLIRAKEAGQLVARRPGREGNRSEGEHLDDSGSGPGRPLRVTLADVGIDRKLSMNAQQLARKAAPLFEQVIAEARAKIEAGRAIVVNPLKELNTADKKLRRRIREAQLAHKQKALPDRLYGVIYADPEWRFETYSEAGLDRAADNHYPTSDLATIKARPVGTLAAPDCVLFLWATAPMLPQALEVMRFWGFEYKSQFVWDKLEEGTGYWNRNRHELLLVGTRGNVPAPAPGTQWPSVIASRPGAHSEKPDWAHELIESYFPNLPKIELNARRLRPGWDAWGLEAPEADVLEMRTGGMPSEQLPGEKPGANGGAAPSSETATAGEGAPSPAPIPTVQRPAEAAHVASVVGHESGVASGGTRALPSVENAGEEAIDLPASPAPNALGDANTIIRDGYAANTPLADLAAATGLSENAVKQRAKRMGLGSRERQKLMSAAANRRRAS